MYHSILIHQLLKRQFLSITLSSLLSLSSFTVTNMYKCGVSYRYGYSEVVIFNILTARARKMIL